MASQPASKHKPRKPATKPRKTVPYGQLLKVATKAKPPQRWYDETGNPFQPAK